MRTRCQWISIGLAAAAFLTLSSVLVKPIPFVERSVLAQAKPTSTPTTAPAFDQAGEIAKLRESIKGVETLPADKVFKNMEVASLKAMPAARILSIMEFGYARSLGVNCTHCHVAGKYEADDKPQKQIAREMAGMVETLNESTLKNIKDLKSAAPTVNCTTCHRGEVKPALTLPQPRN